MSLNSTSGNDTLTGTSGDDTIDGGDGMDTLHVDSLQSTTYRWVNGVLQLATPGAGTDTLMAIESVSDGVQQLAVSAALGNWLVAGNDAVQQFDPATAALSGG